MYPATVAPKLKICTIVAGGVAVSTKSFPLTPAATTKTRRNGAQAKFWYLKKLRRLLLMRMVMLTS